MNNIKQLITIIVSFTFLYLLVFGALVWLVLPKLDSSAAAAIVGALGGALAGILGSTVVSVVGIWDRTRDVKERLKDRVSAHALELTKMDYELRQKSLELLKERQLFLAPTKVYRELYKALLELHEKGTWPKSVDELGLLNIFPLGAEELQDSGESKVEKFETSFVPENDDN